MANNFTTADFSGSSVTLASLDTGSGVQSGKIVPWDTSVDVSMTRTNDSNPYVANDAITTATSSASGYSLSNCGLVTGGMGVIYDAALILSDPNAVLCNFEVWLFDTAPAIPNDNAAFAFTDAEAQTVVAVLQFYSSRYSDSSNNRIYNMWNPPEMFKCNASANLTGVLKTLTAFTPVAQSTFELKLKIIQGM